MQWVFSGFQTGGERWSWGGGMGSELGVVRWEGGGRRREVKRARVWKGEMRGREGGGEVVLSGSD